MTIEEMQKKKIEYGFTCEQIAERSGIPLGTIQKIFSGITRKPRYETICRLEKLFSEETAEHEGLYAKRMQTSVPNGCVRESTSSYQVYGTERNREISRWQNFHGKKQGQYTLEDYQALPDDCRAELIDGVIYDLNTPTTIHQQIAFEISIRLREYIRKNRGMCVVLPSPVSVQLDEDDRTMIQPDIVVCCDREKILRSHVYGVPDMVIEILSPSTRKKDMGLKLQKYISAGVREYWMVDPDKKKIVVYDLENNELPVIFGFKDQVPVNIFGGACQIDFTEIYEYIEFLFEKE